MAAYQVQRAQHDVEGVHLQLHQLLAVDLHFDAVAEEFQQDLREEEMVRGFKGSSRPSNVQPCSKPRKPAALHSKRKNSKQLS